MNFICIQYYSDSKRKESRTGSGGKDKSKEQDKEKNKERDRSREREKEDDKDKDKRKQVHCSLVMLLVGTEDLRGSGSISPVWPRFDPSWESFAIVDPEVHLMHTCSINKEL